MNSLGWLVVPGFCVCALAFWRSAHVEGTARKQALIDQTLEFERTARQPRP